MFVPRPLKFGQELSESAGKFKQRAGPFQGIRMGVAIDCYLRQRKSVRCRRKFVRTDCATDIDDQDRFIQLWRRICDREGEFRYCIGVRPLPVLGAAMSLIDIDWNGVINLCSEIHQQR